MLIFPGALSYGGVRTWVKGSQVGGNRVLAEASNLLEASARARFLRAWESFTHVLTPP